MATWLYKGDKIISIAFVVKAQQQNKMKQSRNQNVLIAWHINRIKQLFNIYEATMPSVISGL